jgi:hypothetical protein
VTLGALRCGVLPYYDQKYNAVLVQGPYDTSAAARTFHEAAFVADLHADPLLWGRDLRKRYTRGQMDLPRLRDGGVYGTCPGPGNLTNAQLRRIAKNAGLVGIGYWKIAACTGRIYHIQQHRKQSRNFRGDAAVIATNRALRDKRCVSFPGISALVAANA